MQQTGLRPSEVFKLTFRSCNFTTFSFELGDAKRGDDRVVPVPKDLFIEYAELLKNNQTITPAHLRSQWKTARQALGLLGDPKFTPGALRHTVNRG